jgi:hypothetical protein
MVHELDAIRRHEWRMFVILNKMDDEKAFQVFSILHAPLFMVMFWLITYPAVSVVFWFQIVLDVFLIIHKFLHDSFQKHPNNEFTTPFSKGLINFIAGVGFVHLILILSLRFLG